MALAIWNVDNPEKLDETPELNFSPATEEDTTNEWMGLDEEEE